MHLEVCGSLQSSPAVYRANGTGLLVIDSSTEKIELGSIIRVGSESGWNAKGSERGLNLRGLQHANNE